MLIRPCETHLLMGVLPWPCEARPKGRRRLLRNSGVTVRALSNIRPDRQFVSLLLSAIGMVVVYMHSSMGPIWIVR